MRISDWSSDVCSSDRGLAASDKIGQRRLIVRDLSHDLRLQLDRRAQGLARLRPALLRIARHLSRAGIRTIAIRIQATERAPRLLDVERQDRKSKRLNSSH